MTEQEKQAIIDQLNTVNLFDMIPQYQELPKVDKEKIIVAFENLIDREKVRLETEK
jgi:hypothetical protein